MSEEHKAELNAYIADEKHLDLPGFYERWRQRVHGWIAQRGNAEVANAVLLVPDMVALMLRLVKDSRVPLSFRSQLAIVIVYAISPIDIVPEVAFGALGLADDALILSMMLLRLMQHSKDQVSAEVLREHWSGEGDIVATIKEVVENKGELINEKIWNKLKKIIMPDKKPEPEIVEVAID